MQQEAQGKEEEAKDKFKEVIYRREGASTGRQQQAPQAKQPRRDGAGPTVVVEEEEVESGVDS